MRVKPHLLLECHYCLWRPGLKLDMRKVAEHFISDHPDGEHKLDLAAICTCGATMKLTASRPTGGGWKDWFLCLDCGGEGFILRRDRGRSIPRDAPPPVYKPPKEPTP